MDLGITGKTALVTGASAGLGYASALALAKEGVKVAINSRSEKNLRRAAEAINKETGFVPYVVPGQLGEPGQAEIIASQAREELGSIDILIGNAGGPPAGMFEDIDRETWRNSAELTLHSAIDLTRAVLDDMRKAKWGRIIYITSVAVRQPVHNLIVSNTLRAGLTGFAKSISNQFGIDGITVNTVCPGYHSTERLTGLAEHEAKSEGLSPDEIYKRWAENAAVRKLGCPEDLGSVIAFLTSRQASYITGAAIPVDGGSYKGLL